jgi:hypothetical protein
MASTTVSIRHNGSECPCGHILNASMALDGSTVRPSPGDVTMCAECGRALQFDEQLSLQPLTVDEFRALPAAIRRQFHQGRMLAELLRRAAKSRQDRPADA